jgi:phosphoenolpyruvate synthase/pyruvate phosphate dikinase
MLGTDLTYWEFLHETFVLTSKGRESGKSEEEIKNITLQRLEQLRESIKNIRFLPHFRQNLLDRFEGELGAKIGTLPVFIRSDTNMEDLKDFTGAGLNLTVFNAVREDQILQAIRDVWASPFTERSYRWRQKYLLNPENVYPSILILPSVNVDKSGVMITTGVLTSDFNDVTVAFNRGAGGAVEGQAAESYLLKHDGDYMLISPSRETSYTVLPESGGIDKIHTHLDQRILGPMELKKLSELAEEIRQRLPGTPGIGTGGPFDVELGFKGGAIWLFQVRPYVENKKARSSGYLQRLDPKLPEDVKILPAEKLETAG